MPRNGRSRPDESFSREELEGLAKIRLKDALAAGQIGEPRLKALWVKFGIEPVSFSRVRPDESFSREELEGLAKLSAGEAVKRGRASYERLKILWDEFGIKRPRVHKRRKQRKPAKGIANTVSDEWLIIHSHLSFAKIGELLGCSDSHVAYIYRKRRLAKPRPRNSKREFLPGTPEPFEPPDGGCDKCRELLPKKFTECQQRCRSGEMTLCEALVDVPGDLEEYGRLVRQRSNVA